MQEYISLCALLLFFIDCPLKKLSKVLDTKYNDVILFINLASKVLQYFASSISHSVIVYRVYQRVPERFKPAISGWI